MESGWQGPGRGKPVAIWDALARRTFSSLELPWFSTTNGWNICEIGNPPHGMNTLAPRPAVVFLLYVGGPGYSGSPPCALAQGSKVHGRGDDMAIFSSTSTEVDRLMLR